MATYAELSAEDRSNLDAFMANLRSWCGEQARTNNHGDALNTGYIADVSDVLAQLGGSDEIPNQSGLAGATAMTKDQVVSVVAHVQAILTNYNTAAHRQLWVLGCGERNLIG